MLAPSAVAPLVPLLRGCPCWSRRFPAPTSPSAATGEEDEGARCQLNQLGGGLAGVAAAVVRPVMVDIDGGMLPPPVSPE